MSSPAAPDPDLRAIFEAAPAKYIVLAPEAIGGYTELIELGIRGPVTPEQPWRTCRSTSCSRRARR